MKLRLIAILAGFLIAMSGAVSAQDQPGPDQAVQDQGLLDQDPPDQGLPNQEAPAQQTNAGVARISLIHGDVSTQRGDSGEWSAATLNQPLVAGDHISTGDRSRSEVQLDYANVLRLDEHAQANIGNLTRSQIQIQLGQGRAHYTVFKDSQAEPEIDTPNVAIHPDRRDGSYDILVASDGRTEVIVRTGSADISTPQGSTRVEKGQMITVIGTGDQTQYKVAEARDRDDFDRWNNDRDHVIHNAQAWKHTNRYYTGSEDLDAYGHWTEVPDYGQVWEPTVGPGWAPYRAGQWVWEPGWGWTWVSYEPWGWAPYHYGRWMYVGGAWGWWPGPVYADPFYYPVWAPAYVSFFGFGGGGWGVGFGFGGGWGSIGWLPVGPCDHFYPWWGPGRTSFNVINITNINNINTRGGWGPLHGGTSYSNIRHAINDPGFRRSLSVVQANQFGHGRMTVQPVSHEMFRNAHLVNGNLPVVPTRQSTQISGRPAAPSTISNRMQNQHFFSNTRKSVVRPTSFENERAQLQNNIRQNSRFSPINGTQANGGNPRSPASQSNTRFSTPGRPGMNSIQTSQAPRSTLSRPGNSGPSNNASNSGWRNFGQGGAANNSQPRSFGQSGAANNTQPRSFGQSGATNNTQPRSFGNHTAAPVERSTGNSGWNSAPRPSGGNDRVATPSRGTNNGGGWQRFTPTPSRPSAGQSMSRSPQNDSWRQPSRGPAADSRSYGNYSRPPLNLRQPIVTPRGGDYSRPSYSRPSNNPPSYSRPSYGGGSYGGNRGGYSAPSRGGGYSAPSRGGYSAPSRGGYSAPSHGGGGSAPRSSGGGGGHSSGGGHSGGGGHSSSSGGGNHHGR